MSATETLSVEARRILESEAYADFFATEVEGLSRAERADKAGKNPSTVSASIKRIEQHIKDGTIPDPRVEGGTMPGQPQRTVDRRGIAEKMMPGASMFVEQMDKADSEYARLNERLAAITTQVEDLSEKRGLVRDIATKAGFNWDEFDAAVAGEELPATDTTAAPAEAS